MDRDTVKKAGFDIGFKVSMASESLRYAAQFGDDSDLLSARAKLQSAIKDIDALYPNGPREDFDDIHPAEKLGALGVI